MDPSIRQIIEPTQVTAPRATPRRDREGERPFLLPGDAAEGGDAPRADEPDPESRAHGADQSAGHKLEDESGRRVDVTA